MKMIEDVRAQLLAKFDQLDDKKQILRAPELRELYGQIKDQPDEQKAEFGQAVNKLKKELEERIFSEQSSEAELPPIDVTAPMDVNSPIPELLGSEYGSIHPLMAERERILDIFSRMGFNASESREIDDEWHMFTSLNFPEGHPARDDYDTFMTEQTDENGNRLIAPAHTSTMQNRLLKKYKSNLDKGEPIAVVVPDRVFRNEDVDARHEHTFYQVEGVFVDKGVNAGMLIATLKTYFSEYFQRDIKVRTQPFYFPFTEPSFEFAAECIFCEQKGCNICSQSGWIELLGCGMIHPNVLKMADIDPKVYTGFAWGGGIERLVMLKYGIEDLRHFHSANLKFLRQFG